MNEIIVNLTPHAVVVFERDGFGQPMTGRAQWTIPPSGTEARLAETARPHVHTLVPAEFSTDSLDTYVQTRAVDYGHVEGLPEWDDRTTYIVPMLVALAKPDRADLVFPYPLVRDEAGRIIGCSGFGRTEVAAQLLEQDAELGALWAQR